MTSIPTKNEKFLHLAKQKRKNNRGNSIKCNYGN